MRKGIGSTIKLTIGINSPNFIEKNTRLICNWNGRYYRGMETVNFIYFFNYFEGDENANVKMYRKSNLELVCDNYHAHNDMVKVILEKSYTYLSHSMKYNAREMQKEYAKEEQL